MWQRRCLYAFPCSTDTANSSVGLFSPVHKKPVGRSRYRSSPARAKLVGKTRHLSRPCGWSTCRSWVCHLDHLDRLIFDDERHILVAHPRCFGRHMTVIYCVNKNTRIALGSLDNVTRPMYWSVILYISVETYILYFAKKNISSSLNRTALH